LNERSDQLRHFLLRDAGQRSDYRSPRSFRSDRPFIADKVAHSERLSHELEDALTQARAWLKGVDRKLLQGQPGVYFAIKTRREYFDPAKFEDLRAGIELVAVVSIDSEYLRVTLFIPRDSLSYFNDKLRAYEESSDQPSPKNAARIERIEEIHFALLDAVWTDPVVPFPETKERLWWEVWIRASRIDEFIYIARTRGIPTNRRVDHRDLQFPGRYVLLVRATIEELGRLALDSAGVAELRSPRLPVAQVLGADRRSHQALSSDLRRRVTVLGDEVAVCILDSGVNYGHPLLAPAVAPEDVFAYSSAWGSADHWNHGTPMAGLALYGDLAEALHQQGPIVLSHVVESVKIAPDDERALAPAMQQDIQLYGQLISEFVAIPESGKQRRRVFSTATTSGEASDDGSPTAWSGAIDRVIAERNRQRLFLISAGNVDGGEVMDPATYPALNEETPIHDPAQAWNALTIGAYTDLTTITDPRYRGYRSLAPAGGLCPQSSTSLPWSHQWPIKPDIVMEGGNFATPGPPQNAEFIDDLALLSTSAEFNTTPFTTFGFTSGATALASRLCAQLSAEMPALWPEAIRALMVHSAEWTPEMLREGTDTEAKRERLLRRFGYGVPNERRALYSARDDATMIVQGTLQPFIRDGGRTKINKMVVHRLPWPQQDLLELEEVEAQIRITLSYFVEPNPSHRGFVSRYSYASHGLRFALRLPGESLHDFEQRINFLARDEDYERLSTQSEWALGRVRDRGCLISDTWTASAASLADCDSIAVLPVGGWWKQITQLRRAENTTRYALIASLRVSSDGCDIYSPIQTLIAAEVPIQAEIETGEQ
jgi:hypothetical protein